jgi:purine nucleoside permease
MTNAGSTSELQSPTRCIRDPGALAALGVTANLLSCSASDHAESSLRLRVKALIVAMFDGETAPWLKNESLGRSFTVPAVDDGSRHRHEHCGMEQLRRLCHEIESLPELLSYNGIRLCAG